MHTSVAAVTTDSAVTAVALRCDSDVHISVTLTVKVVATESAVTTLSVDIAVTLMCTSVSQHCHYQCCHNAVLVFAATALCSFSLSQCCAHRCLTAVGFLLCKCMIQQPTISPSNLFTFLQPLAF